MIVRLSELELILGFYDDQITANSNYLSRIREQILNDDKDLNPKFSLLTIGEVETHFQQLYEEVKYSVVLRFITIAEAALREDYIGRSSRKFVSGQKKRNSITVELRSIYKDVQERARLEDDILETWATHAPTVKPFIGPFKDLLKLRHWLAHGRYWTLKSGRNSYQVDYAFDTVNELIKECSKY